MDSGEAPSAPGRFRSRGTTLTKRASGRRIPVGLRGDPLDARALDDRDLRELGGQARLPDPDVAPDQTAPTGAEPGLVPEGGELGQRGVAPHEHCLRHRAVARRRQPLGDAPAEGERGTRTSGAELSSSAM